MKRTVKKKQTKKEVYLGVKKERDINCLKNQFIIDDAE